MGLFPLADSLPGLPWTRFMLAHFRAPLLWSTVFVFTSPILSDVHNSAPLWVVETNQSQREGRRQAPLSPASRSLGLQPIAQLQLHIYYVKVHAYRIHGHLYEDVCIRMV